VQLSRRAALSREIFRISQVIFTDLKQASNSVSAAALVMYSNTYAASIIQESLGAPIHLSVEFLTGLLEQNDQLDNE